MSSSSGKCKSSGKPVRRRFTTKRGSKTCAADAAEIRRQILDAIKLHRSSSSAAPAAAAPPQPVFVGPQFDSLVESMPLPGPVWSTTAPSILPHAPSAAMEALEFEWGESQAASYSWWLGFLKTLDGNNAAEKSNYPLPLRSFNWLFGQNQNSNLKVGDDQETAALVDSNDQSPSPDEWLMFPNTEDDEGVIVVP